MPYLTESDILARAEGITQRLQKSAGRVLLEARASANEKFDVFLSHSSAEPEKLLVGIKNLFEADGLTVYVDKYSDPQLSPDNVTPETASLLRERMRNSGSLLYVYSQHSKKSRWMPWELGFFDGLKGMVGVVPVTRNQEEAFKGEEYLNLYPYVDVSPEIVTKKNHLWINKTNDIYASLAPWAKGEDEIRSHTSRLATHTTPR